MEEHVDPQWEDIPRPVPSMSYRLAYDVTRTFWYLWHGITRPWKLHRTIGMSAHETARGASAAYQNVDDELAFMEMKAAEGAVVRAAVAKAKKEFKEDLARDIGNESSFEAAHSAM